MTAPEIGVLVPVRLEIIPSHPYSPARFPLWIIIARYRDLRRAGRGWILAWGKYWAMVGEELDAGDENPAKG